MTWEKGTIEQDIKYSVRGRITMYYADSTLLIPWVLDPDRWKRKIIKDGSSFLRQLVLKLFFRIYCFAAILLGILFLLPQERNS